MNQDKSARYHALKRRAFLAQALWSVTFLSVLAVSGGSEALRDVAIAVIERISAPVWLTANLVVGLYLVLLGILHEVGDLPLSFYRGFVLERRYGLSTQTLRTWLRDRVKLGAVAGVIALAAGVAVYAAIRRWPDVWWVVAGIGFAVTIVLAEGLAPVILPLFYRVTPLDRRELRDRLMALSRRAGAPVMDAREWRLGDRTRKGNAMLAGLGRTRRVLVSDTLLKTCSDDEVEAVFAHELGHHAHHDVWKGILLETALAFAGLFLAARVVVPLSARLGLGGVGDVAGLPVLLLATGALSAALSPARNAISRRMERAADRYAWDLRGDATAFVGAMQRLGSQNLAEEEPHTLVRWLFYTHPPFTRRIAAAQTWQAARY